MTAVAVKPAAVETAPLAYLKDFESTGFCMDACCVHLDIHHGGKEPHAQFECAHGVWRFKERIFLTREDSADGWDFNIDGGETRHVQSGRDIYGMLVCGDCGTETVLIDQWYGPLECEGCDTKWTRTTRWSVESVPAGEVSNPLNVIEYAVFRSALGDLQANGDMNFYMWDYELKSDEAKAIGQKYQAVASEDVIAQLEALVDDENIDGALVLWKQLVADAEANGTIDAALEQLAEREAAEEVERAKAEKARRRASTIQMLDGYGPTVPSVTFSSVSARPFPVVRDSAFGRIVEGGAR